jgi:hypothetical protein
LAVTQAGRLGILASSARYKRDIHDMGHASDKLMKLRPVSFRYKEDPTAAQQYGLIAEEVAKVYPELAIRDKDGKPESVAYHLLPAMLLNEVQKQAKTNQQLVKENQALQQRISVLEKKNAQIDTMARRLDALEQNARASQPERLAATLH